MPSKKLTDKYVQNLKPKANQFEIFDKKIRNLTLRVTPRGIKTFSHFSRLSGRNCRIRLGRYPELTLADARAKAQQYNVDITNGRDPRDQIASKPLENDFSYIAQEFIAHSKLNTKSWRETERIITNEFVTRWGRRTLKEISKRAISDVLVEIMKKSGPSASVHAFSRIRRLYSWAIENGYAETSPCLGMKPPAKKGERDHVISDDDVSKIYRACSQLGYPFGYFTQILILTGQRRTEVSSMQWSDINFSEKIWSQKQSQNKAGRAHIVPLCDLSTAILRSIPRVDDKYVFPARGRCKPMSGFSKWKKKLDGLSGVRDWTLHDIRRTVATAMAKQKVPIHVVELILNHQSRTLGGIAGIYNRYDYLDEKREAIDGWTQKLCTIIDAAS